MATTRLILTPESANFPTSSFATLGVESTTLRPVLTFVNTAGTNSFWQVVAWQGLSGALTAVVYDFNSGTAHVTWEVAVEAVSATEAMNADSYATTNSQASGAHTANQLMATSITLTNNDSIAAGDVVRFKLTRNDTNAGTA